MTSVRYEWDDRKRVSNLEKHGVDFAAIERFDWREITAEVDSRAAYGEARVLAYGMLDGRLHAVVHTIRGPVRWIISLRKANRREQALYHARG